MKLIKTRRPAFSRWIGTAAILLLAASAPTLIASEDKEKEKRPAPAAARPAPAQNNQGKARGETPQAGRARSEATPSRSTPAPNYNPPARQDRSPASNPPSRQESSPSYNPPNRQPQAPGYNSPNQQTPSPGYNPSNRQTQSPSNNSRSQQTPAPSYNPPANRPSTTLSPNNSGTPNAQPGAGAPAGSGGWRQLDRSGPTGAPARGNGANQQAPAGPNNSSAPGGTPRQAGPAGARNPQFGGGGNVRLPPGQTTHNSDGSATHRASDGRVIQMDPRGRVTNVEVRGGGQVHYAPNGTPDRIVTRSGAVITNRPGGVRQIVVERPGRIVIVTSPRGQGYIQRPFVVRGHEYYQRTYYVGGRPYVNVYRPYYYHGAYYPYYMPGRYYRPAYYGWAYGPWGRPIAYDWGWGGSPWYGYYGPYFAPYPMYRSPLFWLTDFFIATTLQSAYDQRMDDNAAQAQQANYQAQEAMRPEVKQMIADEVQRQLAQERADSQNSGSALQDAPRDTLPGIFNDGASHALVVHNPLQVNDGSQGCALTEGDVIGFEGNLTPGAESASARVLASRGQDCASDSTVAIPLQDLLDMQNHLRETIDRGLGELQSKAGRGGMPAPPEQAMGAPTASPLASAAPAADPNAAAELSQQAQAATQGEQAVLNDAPALESDGAGASPNDTQPPTVSIGMTTSQVQSALGPPRRVVDLGPKRMFIYSDMKVIFMDDRVTDVQ